MKNSNLKTFTLLINFLTFTTLIGCASHPHEIKAKLISANPYLNLNCDLLKGEEKKKKNALLTYSYKQKVIRNSQFGLVFIFWPSIFAIPSGVSYESEIALIRGQINALMNAKKQKKCNLN